MTEIKISKQVDVPPMQVWPFLDPRKWPDFSNTFYRVSINTKILRLKTIADIHTKFADSQFHFAAKITSFSENKNFAFERFDGPLPGSSSWYLIENQAGCLIENTGIFLHTLADPLEQQVRDWMGTFLEEIKGAL